MILILLDTKTNETRETTKFKDASLFWWSEGNGSCDCNRALVFGDELDEDLIKEFGEGYCYGCKRIIAIDVKGDLEGFSKEEILNKINAYYPKELLVNVY